MSFIQTGSTLVTALRSVTWRYFVWSATVRGEKKKKRSRLCYVGWEIKKKKKWLEQVLTGVLSRWQTVGDTRQLSPSDRFQFQSLSASRKCHKDSLIRPLGCERLIISFRQMFLMWVLHSQSSEDVHLGSGKS